jgi:hypothetical protein
MNNIYSNLLVKNNNKVIQYLTKDQIKKVKKKFLITDFVPYSLDIN